MSSCIGGCANLATVAFYRNIMSDGYELDKLITALPRYKLICVVISKVALSKVALTRIGKILAKIDDRLLRSFRPSTPLNYRGSHRGDFDRFSYPHALMPSVGRNQTSTRESFEHRAKMLRPESTCSTQFVTQVVISAAVRSPDQIKSKQMNPNLLDFLSDALRTLG